MLKRSTFLGTIGVMDGIDAVQKMFARSLVPLFQFTQEALCSEGQNIWYAHTDYNIHDHARNDLVSQMRGDWLLMLDCDMAPAPDLCARLVRVMYEHDLDVVTALYSYKMPPHYPVVYGSLENNRPIVTWDRSKPLFPIKWCGAGSLLIRRRTLERMTKEFGGAFSRLDAKGEDLSFFKRLEELRIVPYCAWRIQSAHLAYHPVLPETHFDDSYYAALAAQQQAQPEFTKETQ